MVSIKMNILPKRLSFSDFTNPCPFSFQKHCKLIYWILCGPIKATGSWKFVLFASWSDTGLAFLNLLTYYHATQLRAMASWSTLYAHNRWTEIEKLWVAPVHLNNLLWNAEVPVAPGRLLFSMSFLRNSWKALNENMNSCWRPL